MKDLTTGPIPRHIVDMAIPIAVGMTVQTLYYLVDLFFVGRLGDVALAGVGAAGNTMFIILALSQMLGVSTVTLISHAVGRKDRDDANLIFNQSLLLAAAFGALTLVGGYLFADTYLRTIAADLPTVAAGKAYLYCFLPGMALQFAVIAMGSALRGTGIVKPTMMVQMFTVVINIILAPILIAGVGTGHPLGTAGAGLASTIAVVVGVLLLLGYFAKLEKYVTVHPELWRPRLRVWRRMLAIGFPAGGEFFLMFAVMAVVYWAIRDFGAAAQAGYGVGQRVMQAVFLPAMAMAFAAPAVAGQNFGAGLPDRVRQTFRWAVMMSGLIMLLLTLLCQIKPSLLVRGFSSDAEVVAIAATFLRFISWNFLPSAVILSCSGLFQALGNTWPALLSSGCRFLFFAIPVVFISQMSGFRIEHVWYVSVATTSFQAVISFLLLQREFRRRLGFLPQVAVA